MTEANQKIMYEDFMKRSQDPKLAHLKKYADDILAVYPQFAPKVEELPKAKPKTKPKVEASGK